MSDSKMYEDVDDEKDSGGNVPAEEADKSAAQIPKVPSAPTVPKSKKCPELPLLERKNWLIHFHYVRREFESCRALVEEQLSETKGMSEYPLYVKGLMQRHEGKITEAVETFQNCAALNSQNTTYLKQIARCFFLLGKHKSAIAVYEELLRLNPDDWETHHWKGNCLYHSQELQAAKDALKMAINISRHEESYVLLGKIFTDEGDLMNAIDVYKRALEVSPESPDLLTTLGLLYMKAFEALGRALSFNPSHSGAIVAAGGMIQLHGDYDVALTKYRIATVDWPDSPQLWSNIAMCFYGKSKYVAAISCLKRANYLAPFDWKILHNLGIVHLCMFQYASAFNFLSAAININPKVASLFVALAIALTNLEDYTNAKQAYDHAVKLDPKDPVVCLNYAIFAHKQNDTTTCTTMLNAYQSRLNQAKDPKSFAKIDAEVTETAEKLRFLLAQSGKGQVQPSRIVEPEDEPVESNLTDTNSIRSLAEGIESEDNSKLDEAEAIV